MNRLAIISIAIGSEHQRLSEVTFPFIQKYADNINADFIKIIEKKISETTPHWEKFQLYKYLETYDRIVYLDADILIRSDADNLFDIVPEQMVGMFNEAPFTDNRVYAIESGAKDYNIKGFQWDGRYFNTGVMVLSKEHRFIFKKPQIEVFNFFEQTYINLIIQKHQIPIYNLHYKYNRMCCMDSATGEPRHSCQLIHYAGISPVDMVINIAKKDADILSTSDKDKVWPKNIWISVEGGLGDQIQAEPTVRFLKEKLHPNDDIRVTTHFPEIFRHIKGIQVETHDVNIWAGVTSTPFKKITLPNPEQPLWMFLSNMLCHTVDFAAISVLRRTLPDIDKEYILSYPIEAQNSLCELCKRDYFSDCVLIHAGQHWSNKSFPASYWEEIVHGLREYGLTPILIGKNEETRGVVRLKAKDGVINLVNMLSLHELFAIIDLCPVLISNDSAPIHIAGAFDNNIILIPTCKHPDYLLPWRQGSKYYKAKAMYKKLLCDEIPSSPTEVYQILGDKLLGEWNCYLPETSSVVKQVINILEGSYGQ